MRAPARDRHDQPTHRTTNTRAWPDTDTCSTAHSLVPASASDEPVLQGPRCSTSGGATGHSDCSMGPMIARACRAGADNVRGNARVHASFAAEDGCAGSKPGAGAQRMLCAASDAATPLHGGCNHCRVLPSHETEWTPASLFPKRCGMMAGMRHAPSKAPQARSEGGDLPAGTAWSAAWTPGTTSARSRTAGAW